MPLTKDKGKKMTFIKVTAARTGGTVWINPERVDCIDLYGEKLTKRMARVFIGGSPEPVIIQESPEWLLNQLSHTNEQ